MNVLRGIAYILTSLASALFIVVVIYGYVLVGSANERLQTLFPAGPTGGGEQFPGARTTGELMYCADNPDDPDCY